MPAAVDDTCHGQGADHLDDEGDFRRKITPVIIVVLLLLFRDHYAGHGRNT